MKWVSFSPNVYIFYPFIMLTLQSLEIGEWCEVRPSIYIDTDNSRPGCSWHPVPWALVTDFWEMGVPIWNLQCGGRVAKKHSVWDWLSWVTLAAAEAFPSEARARQEMCNILANSNVRSILCLCGLAVSGLWLTYLFYFSFCVLPVPILWANK